MALNKRPTFVNRPSLGRATILNADAQALKPLIVAGTSGDKVVGLFASGEVTANRDLQIVLTRGAVDSILATVAVPLNSGRTNALPPIDLFTTALRALLPKDGDAQPYLFLASGDTLNVRALTTVTATEAVTVFAVHGAFDDEVA